MVDYTQHQSCNVLGFQKTNSLGKYLGVPIKGKKFKRADCDFFIDKLNNKLASWKANTLSTAGRHVLAQATLNAILNYYYQASFLLVTVHSQIGGIIRKKNLGLN